MMNDDVRRPGTPLTDEHAEVLGQVTVLAEAVNEAARAGWGAEEWKALLDYVHGELIDQVRTCREGRLSRRSGCASRRPSRS